MIHTLTCIVCPKGCRISAREHQGELVVSGNLCIRGEVFAKKEFLHPERILTTTVKVKCGTKKYLPVISSKEIPLELIEGIVQRLAEVCVVAPISMKERILINIDGAGTDLLASCPVERK